MAIQSDETLITKGDLKTLYTDKILPYLGGNMMMQTGVSDYYSTDEKIVGVWTDGKPVYQKTVQLSAMTSAVTMYQMTDLGISDIDKPLFLEGFMINSTGWKLASPFWQTASDFMVMSLFNEQIRICSPSWSTYTSGYATIKYTKTTDAANSAVTTPGCYDINRPDLWPANQEIFFGNGLYGSRLIGSATLEVGARQDVVLTGSITNNTRLISQGGQLKTPNNWSLPLTMSFSLTYEVSRMEAFIFPLYTEGKLKMYMLVNNPNDVGTYNYDVWVTYTK